MDLLLKNQTQAHLSPKIPKNEPDISNWHLNDMIEVSVDIKIVTQEVARLSHSVREYRNLIHPARELKSQLKVEPEEAKIAVQILNILIRELSWYIENELEQLITS